MSARADEIIAADTQIVWLLQDTQSYENASGDDSFNFFTSISASRGVFVGDASTVPNLANGEDNTTWEDNSVNSFRGGRGSTMLVRKRDMKMVYGSDRPTVDTILREIGEIEP